MRPIILAILILLITILINGCAPQKDEIEQIGMLQLTSTDFANNGNIPSKYTCDGQDASPPLEISGMPSETKSLALIVDDPDAPSGVWTHWLVWNIPSSNNRFMENALPQGTLQGKNDFGENNYGGPCPPSGTHSYRFKLYALDIELNLQVGATKQEVEGAMQGHILAQTTLIGKYGR